MLISGWGGHLSIDADVKTPVSIDASEMSWETPMIARGMGRGYGDCALGERVLKTTAMDRFIEFNQEAGLLTIEAGVTIREILRLMVPHGWFIKITPGTSHVTVGGAIASDVHGKNHHVAGTFSESVVSMNMLLGTGETVEVSAKEKPDLFRATCGGMGLTGIILTATLQLVPIKTSLISQKTIKSRSLEETLESFSQQEDRSYSVAWVDCLARGSSLGRSVLQLGEHAEQGPLDCQFWEPITVPFYTPAFLINKWSMSAFNELWYRKARQGSKKSVSFDSFFYPLDVVPGWNKLYGRAGFVQYQFVLPYDNGLSNLRLIMKKITESGMGSFLAVFKQFGDQNENLLSFPMKGYALALDFKWDNRVKSLFSELDAMVADMGGRIYLSKDALMSEAVFKATYPSWQAFESVREKYGAAGKFSSVQSKRLGLA